LKDTFDLEEAVSEPHIITREKLKQARRIIRQAIKTNGPYSHNIISLSLASVMRKFGVHAANKLVDEFDLEELYGIRKEKVDSHA
jgi:hypothetical protein